MTINFQFPLPRVHTGIHLANGRMGALVWGDSQLHITVAHAGFWDRRGGRPFATPVSYAELRKMLLAGEESQVREAFAQDECSPYQIGGGRFEIRFGSVEPISATLETETGLVCVEMTDGSIIQILQSMQLNRIDVNIPDNLLKLTQVRLRPSWEWVHQDLTTRNVEPPTIWRDEGVEGFRQSLPSDPALTIESRIREGGLTITAHIGSEPMLVIGESEIDTDTQATNDYWRAFWDRITELPDVESDLREPLMYSIWKLGCLTSPTGVAATLQGPWMEEHRIPLWSNDYHFNINLEMIYWPCLHLGLGDHLRPLWTMIHGWMPKLFGNGKRFFGIEGAAMLPHAVDDQCHPIGSYWQGTIDHASTAWTAQLAWLDYQKHHDSWVLQEIAWPLLIGAFEGYYAMLEEDGEALVLPISVSPEFGEGAIGTWGPNASFQLAAIHMLCVLLPQAADAMREPYDERWAVVAKRLPRHSLSPVPLGVYDDPHSTPRCRIGLWRGQDLTESHRHHSHLAGLYPFGSLQTEDSEVLEQTLKHWAYLGGGQWSSWGTIWAVCIMARAGWKQGARAWLRLLLTGAINEGKSLSAGGARGCFISWGSADVAREHHHEGDHEVMQLDANIGLITACFEAYSAVEV